MANKHHFRGNLISEPTFRGVVDWAQMWFNEVGEIISTNVKIQDEINSDLYKRYKKLNRRITRGKLASFAAIIGGAVFAAKSHKDKKALETRIKALEGRHTVDVNVYEAEGEALEPSD